MMPMLLYFQGSVMFGRYSYGLLKFFFFNGTATTEIYTVPYTLSLHDALPIFCWSSPPPPVGRMRNRPPALTARRSEEHTSELQSHGTISYAVCCLKKKTEQFKVISDRKISIHEFTNRL